MERESEDGTIYKSVGNDEWEQIIKTDTSGVSYKKMSNDEWEPIKPQKSLKWYEYLNPKKMAGDAINIIGNALNTYDEYTGAPIRKYVSETLTGKEFENAPSGADQAKMLGASDVPYSETLGIPKKYGGGASPADIYGVGLEMVQDPFLIGSGLKSVIGEAGNLLKSGGKKFFDLGKYDRAFGPRKEFTGDDISFINKKTLVDVKPPSSLDELLDWVPDGKGDYLLSGKRIKEIVNSTPEIKTKPFPYHYRMLEKPNAMKEYKLEFKLYPDKVKDQMSLYNNQMLNESSDLTTNLINKVTGGTPQDMAKAGENFLNKVKDIYNVEKNELGPMFQQLQENSKALNQSASQDLIMAIAENNNKVKKLLAQGEDGFFTLRKNTPRTGLSKQEYTAIKDVIEDLNTGMTFKEVQNAREYLRKLTDVTNPSATRELKQIRSIMKDQLQFMANDMGPDLGKLFKDYSINEESINNLESILGGKLKNLNKVYSANPEKAINRVFSNPNYSNAVRKYIGDEEFNKLIGSYLNNGWENAIHSTNGVSHAKFKTWLKSNRNFLEKNVSPKDIDSLNKYADYGYLAKRFLDDVNPSGSADLWMAAEKKAVKFIHEPVSQSADIVLKQGEKRNIVSKVNRGLGRHTKPSFKTKDALKKGNELIDSALFAGRGSDAYLSTNKAFIEKDKTRGPSRWAQDGFKKITNNIKDNNLNKFLNENQSVLFKNKKIKNLFIEASSLKANSKGLNDILKKIEIEYKKGGKK